MNRSAASRTPRYHLPAFFAPMGQSAVSAPNTNGECSVDPSVAPALRSSTRLLRQVFDCPPGLGPSPPVIVANITRLGIRPLFWYAMASAMESRRLRVIVSMLSHRVREGGVVGTLSALEAINSQEDLVVRHSELGKVFRTEGPSHTPV